MRCANSETKRRQYSLVARRNDDVPHLDGGQESYELLECLTGANLLILANPRPIAGLPHSTTVAACAARSRIPRTCARTWALRKSPRMLTNWGRTFLSSRSGPRFVPLSCSEERTRRLLCRRPQSLPPGTSKFL